MAGLVIGVLGLFFALTMLAGDVNELKTRVASLERVAVLQQKYNDQIDSDVTRLENRTREMVR